MLRLISINKFVFYKIILYSNSVSSTIHYRTSVVRKLQSGWKINGQQIMKRYKVVWIKALNNLEIADLLPGVSAAIYLSILLITLLQVGQMKVISMCCT